METNKNKQYLIWGLLILVIILLFMWIGKGSDTESPVPQPQDETPITSNDGNAPEGSVHNQPVSPAVAAARVLLASRLDMKVLDVVVLSEKAVEWPDACLGISSPGLLCAQVITSGYEVKMLAQGNEYTYRTNANGSLVKAEN